MKFLGPVKRYIGLKIIAAAYIVRNEAGNKTREQKRQNPIIKRRPYNGQVNPIAVNWARQ